MRKLTIFSVLIFTIVSCKNTINDTHTSLKSDVKSSILSSIFGSSSQCESDSCGANTPTSIRNFNFLLKDGFANKFGL